MNHLAFTVPTTKVRSAENLLGAFKELPGPLPTGWCWTR